jgi:phage regulatory protein, rha family
MKELVFKGEGNQALTNSLLVAEKFGKEHRRVMQDIRELGCSEEFRLHNFVQSSYINSQNKEMPMIIMTKDGFTLLAMGYTGDMAMKFKEEYIAAFNTMEQTLKSGGFQVPTSFREALLLAAQQQEKIEEQQKQLAEQAPKVLFANAVETSQKSCLIGELAKILRQNGVNIGEKRLFSWMREKGYLCSYGERYNQPTQKSMDLELFEMKKTTITKPSGEILVSVTSKVSGKGQVYFVNKFLKQKELV